MDNTYVQSTQWLNVVWGTTCFMSALCTVAERGMRNDLIYVSLMHGGWTWYERRPALRQPYARWLNVIWGTTWFMSALCTVAERDMRNDLIYVSLMHGGWTWYEGRPALRQPYARWLNVIWGTTCFTSVLCTVAERGIRDDLLYVSLIHGGWTWY
jgi:energy-converting hydrogenase Eha subunit C